MSASQWLANLEPATISAFVRAARHVIDALLIEGQRIQSAGTPPPPRDYATADLDRSTPTGGWLTPDDLRNGAQRLAEAVAAEKWIEGFKLAVMLLSQLRP